MANKLKKMQLTSVDMVRNGANQEADICLYKGAAGAPGEPTTEVQKDYSTFDTLNGRRESSEKLWQYSDALTCSIRSIQEDRDLGADQKFQMMKQSLEQFNDAMVKLFLALINDNYDVIVEVPAVAKANPWHDPATGRFSSGPGGAAGGVASRTVTNGGISYHVKSGKEPKTGYMCATYTSRAEWIKGDEVSNPEKRTARIKAFMEKNKDVLSDPDNYLGTWFDTESGNISLDISRNFSSKSAAIKFATEHNEKAIWDVANMAEISTGGTGNNL